jgi:hypothetical protein
MRKEATPRTFRGGLPLAAYTAAITEKIATASYLILLLETSRLDFIFRVILWNCCNFNIKFCCLLRISCQVSLILAGQSADSRLNLHNL